MTKPVHEIFNKVQDGPDLLFLGPTMKCACGCEVFHALVWFDQDDRSIGGYFTEGCCSGCGSLVRLATQHPSEWSG